MNQPECSLPHAGVPRHFNMTQYCLASAVQHFPDKIALRVIHDVNAPLTEQESWTFSALEDAVLRLANGLSLLKLMPGDRLLLRLGNTSANALLFFASIAAGYVPIPVSDQLTSEEVSFLLDDASVAVIASDQPADWALVGQRQLLSSEDIQQLYRTVEPADYAKTLSDDPAFLIYTSGTTNQPKGVVHAHRSAWGRRPMYEGWYGLRSDDIMLHAGALNWTYTLGAGLTDPWANGATAVVYSGPRNSRLWPDLINLVGATLFAAVPSVYRQILKYCDLQPGALASLRHGLTAGEALSPELLGAWRNQTATELYEALGMSECSTYISTAPGMATQPASPGKAQPGRRIAILPITGEPNPLPPGETGLLAIHRSDPGLMLGYWQRPDEEAKVFRGDWFVGGDLASMDDEGYVYFQGRHDDVMNALGYRVSPFEVEQCLARHPAVQEVAVTEVAVRSDLSIITAFVVLAKAGDGACPLDKDTLLAFAHQHLADYKCPKNVVFTSHLPRTANGKILRRALRERG